MRPLALRALLLLGYGLILYGITFHTSLANSASGAVFLLLIYGTGLGIAGQLVFDWHRRLSFLATFIRTALVLLVLSALLVAFAYETLICVAVILPIALLLTALGIWVTRLLLNRFERIPTACLSVLVLPFVITAFDLSAFNHAEIVSVTSTITIGAPAARVRALAKNVSDIAENERPWTFTHTLLRAPRPVSASTIEGIRHARWTHGITFQEHLLPGPDLAWAFTFPDPEALKALDPRLSPTGPEVTMLTGRYRFEPVGPNRTRVTLTTTYRLNTPINAYLKPWGRLFLNDFHMAVLQVISSRAESPT